MARGNFNYERKYSGKNWGCFIKKFKKHLLHGLKMDGLNKMGRWVGGILNDQNQHENNFKN